MELAREAEVTLGFAPVVSFDGPIDAGVPDVVAPHVVAVVREALSNAARHARASAVAVRAGLADDWLTVTVTDDGRGTGALTRSSGLANLRERALLLHGSFEISPGPSGGTQLEWRVSTRP
jgi:signal transduction histidine kinase